MSLRLTVLLVIALLTLGLISDADAFDGYRKGFFLGGGIGPGVTSFTQTVGVYGVSVTSDRENAFGVHTDWRIGYGLSEFVQIYWSSKVSLFGMENIYGTNVMVAHGVGGIGLTYYFQRLVPSVFVTGSVGYSSWAEMPRRIDTDVRYGFGISGGVGYEFATHWSVECSVTYADPSVSEIGLYATTNAIAFNACVTVFAY